MVALALASHFFNMANSTTGISPGQAQATLRILLEGPAVSPPAGVVSNFDDPANLDIYVNLCNILGIALATVAVISRMYTKVFILRVLAWEDCGIYFLPHDFAAVYLLLPLRCHSPCMGKVACGN